MTKTDLGEAISRVQAFLDASKTMQSSAGSILSRNDVHLYEADLDALVLALATPQDDGLRELVAEVDRLYETAKAHEYAVSNYKPDRHRADIAAFRAKVFPEWPKLSAALALLPDGAGWRPISEAPKDGTELLLWIPGEDGGSPYVGKYYDRNYLKKNTTLPNGEVGWRISGYKYYGWSSKESWEVFHPSHWKTINAPEASGEG